MAPLRWQRPELGLVMPKDFIALADFTGVLLSVGPWVLETACRQGREWQRRGSRHLRMMVNMSAYELQQPELVANVEKALAASGLEPDTLHLEIPEGYAMQNIDRAIAAGPDGIAVTVLDGASFEEPMMKAIDAGIPVLAYDTGDMRPKDEQIPYLTFIGSDEYLSGYKAADRLYKTHEGAKGVVRYMKEHNVTMPVVAKALGNNQEETWEIFRANGVHVVTDPATEKAVEVLAGLVEGKN